MNGTLYENHHSICSYFDGFNELCGHTSKKKIQMTFIVIICDDKHISYIIAARFW